MIKYSYIIEGVLTLFGALLIYLYQNGYLSDAEDREKKKEQIALKHGSALQICFIIAIIGGAIMILVGLA